MSYDKAKLLQEIEDLLATKQQLDVAQEVLTGAIERQTQTFNDGQAKLAEVQASVEAADAEAEAMTTSATIIRDTKQAKLGLQIGYLKKLIEDSEAGDDPTPNDPPTEPTA